MNYDAQNRNNNIKRSLYFIFFIIILILVSIIYASLAINFGVKVNKEKPKSEPAPEPTKEVINYIPRKVIPKEEPIEVKPPEDINWKIYFDNIKVKEGSIKPVVDAFITDSKTEVLYVISLEKPGDYYSFDVDVINDGNIDAEIYNIIEKSINDRQKKFLDYRVTYSDGKEISLGDNLLKNTKKTISIYLKYKDDLNPEDLPEENDDLSLSYKIDYVQK